jgi:hypothetical protein
MAIFENFTPSQNLPGETYGVWRAGQTWRISEAYTLTKIKVGMFSYNSTANAVVTLKVSSADSTFKYPSGSVLATVTASYAQSSTMSEVTFNISSLSLTYNTFYCFYLSSDISQPWLNYNSGSYTNHNLILSGDSGSTWATYPSYISYYITEGTTNATSPTIATQAAGDIHDTYAYLGSSGTVLGNADCFVYFQYGTTTGYGLNSGVLYPVTGTGSQLQYVYSLSPKTLYHFRPVIYNVAGTGYGSDATFTTLASIPTVSEGTVVAESSSTVTVPYSITNVGGENASARGVCYATATLPTTANSVVQVTGGSYGVGGYSASITGLSTGTTYHSRAYAVNSAGIGYSNEVDFMTLTLPIVTLTKPVAHLSSTGVSVTGNITDLGGASAATARGFCYATATIPTTANSTAGATGSFTTGTYNYNITGISSGMQYHARAFAINSAGVGYSSSATEVHFYIGSQNSSIGVGPLDNSQSRLQDSYTAGTTDTLSFMNNSGYYRRCQVFTASSSYTLKRFSLEMRKSNAAAVPIVVKLLSVSGGTPGSFLSPLATSTTSMNASDLGDAYAWYNFDFDGYSLVSGTQYGLFVEIMQSYIYQYVYLKTGNGYASGAAWYKNDAYPYDWVLIYISDYVDWNFKVWGIDSVQIKNPTIKIGKKINTKIGIKRIHSLYNTVSMYSSVSDGIVGNVQVDTWALARDSATGAIVETTGNTVSSTTDYFNSKYNCIRGFLYFDTSSLPDDCTIVSAQLSVYGKNGAQYQATDPQADGLLYEGTQSSALAASDFNKFGSVLLSDDFTNWQYPISTVGYNAISLNSAGKALINKTGITQYCIRIKGDVDNNSPASTNQFVFHSIEAGTAYAPKLSITYSMSSIILNLALGTKKTTKLGLKSSILKKLSFIRQVSTKVGLKSVLRSFSLARKFNTKIGLKTISPTRIVRFIKINTTKVGLTTVRRGVSLSKKLIMKVGLTTVRRAILLSKKLITKIGLASSIVKNAREIKRSILTKVGIYTQSLWSNYTYCKIVTVNPSIDGALSSYPMKLTIHRTTGVDTTSDVYVGTECSFDYSDIYFDTELGEPLWYWIESYTDNEAVVWIKAINIPASPTITSIRFYYGSSIISIRNSGLNTFTFFDDFSAGLSKWTTDSGCSIVGEELIVQSTASVTNAAYSTTSFGTNYAMRARLKSAHYNSLSYIEEATITSVSDGHGLGASYSNIYSVMNGYYFSNDISGFSYSAISGWSADAYHIQDLIRNNGTSDIFRVDSANEVVIITDVSSDAHPIRFLTNVNGAKINVDWTLIRKWTTNEPTFGTWGSKITYYASPYKNYIFKTYKSLSSKIGAIVTNKLHLTKKLTSLKLGLKSVVFHSISASLKARLGVVASNLSETLGVIKVLNIQVGIRSSFIEQLQRVRVRFLSASLGVASNISISKFLYRILNTNVGLLSRVKRSIFKILFIKMGLTSSKDIVKISKRLSSKLGLIVPIPNKIFKIIKTLTSKIGIKFPQYGVFYKLYIILNTKLGLVSQFTKVSKLVRLLNTKIGVNLLNIIAGVAKKLRTSVGFVSRKATVRITKYFSKTIGLKLTIPQRVRASFRSLITYIGLRPYREGATQDFVFKLQASLGLISNKSLSLGKSLITKIGFIARRTVGWRQVINTVLGITSYIRITKGRVKTLVATIGTKAGSLSSILFGNKRFKSLKFFDSKTSDNKKLRIKK